MFRFIACCVKRCYRAGKLRLPKLLECRRFGPRFAASSVNCYEVWRCDGNIVFDVLPYRFGIFFGWLGWQGFERFRTLEGPLVPKLPPTWPRCGCSKNLEGKMTSCDIIMLKFFRAYPKKTQNLCPSQFCRASKRCNQHPILKHEKTKTVQQRVLSKTNGVIFDAFFSFLCWVSSKPAWGPERNRSADKLGVLDGSWGMSGWKVLEVCLSSVCIISSFHKNS